MRDRLVSVLAFLSCCGQICLITACLGKAAPKTAQISPTGKYRAELIEADTGAAGGWMSAVRVSEVSPSAWESLSGRGKETVFGADLRSTHIGFAWKDDRHLEIRCSECDASRITLQKNAWRDVTISYKITGAPAR